jgi:hypothetical protein
VVICVFRDSLNYFHIARGLSGAMKWQESIIQGMDIADGPTERPHSRLWILQLGGYRGQPLYLLQAVLCASNVNDNCQLVPHRASDVQQ